MLVDVGTTDQVGFPLISIKVEPPVLLFQKDASLSCFCSQNVSPPPMISSTSSSVVPSVLGKGEFCV